MNKTLVIFGSSVALGTGATDEHGWANRLKALLTPRGYRVINRSVRGNKTLDLIRRFESDVLPERPDYVIIGLSLANEGLVVSNPMEVYQQYMTNMLRLVCMVQDHGIRPVVASTYPHNAYSLMHHRLLRRCNREIESWGVPCIDFLGATDDLTGKWLPGTWTDPWHPNDAGHEEMFRAIPPSLFDHLPGWSDQVRPSRGDGLLPERPLLFRPNDPMRSFTTAFWFKPGERCVSQSVCEIGLGQARIRWDEGVLTYAPAGIHLGFAARAEWHHLAVTHNTLEGVTRFYLNGALVGETAETFPRTGPFALGVQDAPGVPRGVCAYKDWLMYRTRLDSDQVHRLYRGRYKKASLELFVPLSADPSLPGGPLANLAPTDASVTVAVPVLQSAAV